MPSASSPFKSFQIEADPRADEAIENELPGGGVGTVLSIAALSLVPSRMEDTMCWEIDYKFFAEQKKAKEIEQQRRVIDQLLNEAQKQDDKSNVEEMPVKETAPAK
jgi:hypothetical protein